MKRIYRIITILMAAAFFMTGIPAVQTFAAEENGTPVVTKEASAEEQGVPEQEAQGEPEEAPAETSVQPEAETPQEEPQKTPDVVAAEAQLPNAQEELQAEEAKAAEEQAVQKAENPAPEETAGTARQSALFAEAVLNEDGKNTGRILRTIDAETPGKKGNEENKDGEEIKPGKTALTVTNETNMFKVVDAYIETQKDGSMELVIALSGESYSNLFLGTFEEAVKVGYNTSKWIPFFTDANGRKAFRILIDRNSSYLPVISISDTYLKKYLKKVNPLSRAFYARQLVLDQKKKTLVAGDLEKTEKLTVKNNAKNLDVESAKISLIGGPNNNAFAANLIAKLKNGEYDSAFIGTKTDAAEAEKTIPIGKDQILTLPLQWLAKFGDPDSLVSLMGKTFTVSFHSSKNQTWFELDFTVNEKTKILTIDIKNKKEKSSTDDIVIPGQKSSKEKQKKQKQKQKQQEAKKQQAQDTIGGGTAAVNNSTGLKDGIYKPDKFSFSGGTGKIAITCSQVEVREGKAYATIEFRNTKSGTSEFSYVKANGQQYSCSQVGGVSVVTIPVELNANTPILGMTTKMSAAHEIAYTIFVYINGADEKAADDLTKNKDFDKEAPKIAGLEVTGEEVVEAAQNFKVFNYSDGIRLLEIDMRTDSGKAEKKDAEEKKADDEDEAETTIIDEETGEEIVITADKGAAQAKLYKGNIIKYLLVPEGVEIPAGLDKETIVVPLPVKKVYAGSDAIRKLMKQLGVENQIACMEKEDGTIKSAGSFEDLKLRTLVKEKCDAVIVPGNLLKTEKGRETFETQAEDLANLDIALIADRSSFEKSKKAKAEWIKVYGMLFGCEQAANEAFQAVN